MPEITPSIIEQWQRDAAGALARRQFATAEKLCKQLLDATPRNAHAHFLLALLADATGQTPAAAKLLQRALALGPARAEYFAQLARMLVKLRETEAASAAADRALELQPDEALTLDTIGCVYSHAADHSKAAELFRAAVKREPGNPDFQFNLASSLRFLGDFSGSEEACEAAIRRSPGYYKAHWSLANLARQSPEHNHVPRLRAVLKSMPAEPEARAFIHNALAKELDDLGETGPAFEHLARGKALIRRELDYDPSEDERLFAHLAAVFDEDLLRQPVNGCETEEPVFIVGMPRTGTTLVERILSSHSQVYAAGELRNFALQLKLASGTRTPRVLDEATVDAGLRADSRALGAAYLASTRPATGHTQRFIDKTPLNFLNIGFIHRALPQARIICLHRNPMDTCLSNFRQMFAPDASPYYKYSFDLLETGRYYLLFDRLMRHWDRILTGKILHVQYEEVVRDQEAQSRRLVEFCKLGWEAQCLSFERNSAPVATASSVQVREPIYSDAAARWKRYREPMAALEEFFRANGVAIEPGNYL